MLATTYVEIDVLPVFSSLFRYESLVVVRIHIAEIVGRRASKSRHGI